MRTLRIPLLIFSLLLLLIGILFTLVACRGKSSLDADVKVEDINACTVDIDCILVDANFCGGTTAINVANLENWNRHLELERLKNPNVVCAPSLPREAFEARCLQSACRALFIEERAYLQFSAKPALNTPVELTFHIKFASDMPNTRARIESIPDGLEVISGSLEWQGSLKAGIDEAILLTVMATRTGYYQVKGIVEAERNGQKTRLEDVVYVEVTPDDAIFGSQPVNNWGKSNIAYPSDDDHGLIESELVIAPEPALGQEFTVTYRITPRLSLTQDQVFMLIGIPQEITVVDQDQVIKASPKGLQVVRVEFPPHGENYPDNLAWRGAIDSNQTVEIRVVFKVIEEGWGAVYGMLNVQAGGMLEQYLQDAVVIEIHVDKYRGYYLPMSP